MTTPYAGQIRPRTRARPGCAWGGLLLTALVVVVFLACALIVLAIIGSDTGVTGVLVGLALAAVPVFVVVPALLWLDRFEAEPTGLLLFAFGWGAAVATLVAILVNSTSIALLKASGGDVTAGAVVIAPIVEETCKGLAVLLVFLYRRREFDGVIDGIVYAGMAGIGFAFTENVLYLGRALADSGRRTAWPRRSSCAASSARSPIRSSRWRPGSASASPSPRGGAGSGTSRRSWAGSSP